MISARQRVETTFAALDRAAALNAVTDLVANRARRQAAAVDSAPPSASCLAGAPFAVKDLFDIAGLPTRAGSKINLDRPPAARDATAVERLERAGAVLVAATAMDEYAYGYTSENAHTGPARNPRDPSRTPGGSSGGSAALVATGCVPLALGTDTNGSIRVPAALSGCFGLKPTFGRLSRRGVFPFAASLDHVGVLARGTADLAAAYDALQGPDPGDPVCSARSPELVAGGLGRSVYGLRVATARGYFAAPLEPDARVAVERAAEILGAGGATIEIPAAERARAAGFVITASEAGNLHRRALATRPLDFDPLVRDRLLAGALVPGTWYLQAQRFRRWFVDALAREVFARCDLVILPATPCTAPPVAAETVEVAGCAMPARLALGLFVQPLTIAGLPIAVAPMRGARTGLPVGVQLMANVGREDLALRAAAVLERAGYAQGLADG